MDKRTFLRSGVAAAALSGLGQAHAASLTIKAATQNPKGHPIVQGLEKFAELVEQRSNGAIKVKVFPGGTLGNDQANVTALQGGTLEMMSLNSGILATQIKAFAAYDLPFLFASTAQADAVVDGVFGQKLNEQLATRGLIGLASFELGFRNLTNSKRPILKIEDIAGLKLRVIPNPINVAWVEALGANPTPLPFPEVYGALEQKAIDGQENPLTVIDVNKFAEVQKHLALTRHQYNPQSVLLSQKFWKKLDPAQQELVRKAAQEAAVFQRGVARAMESQSLENLKKAGMQITELPAAEQQRMREKMKPVVEKFSAEIGADTVAMLRAELAKVAA